MPRVLAAQGLGGKVEHVVCVDGDPEGCINLADVEAAPAPGLDFAAAWQAVRPTDLLTIVYTSGTTGLPKGVELTHANLLANIEYCDAIEAGPLRDERVLSYLPDAHLANRWVAHYTQLVNGSGRSPTSPTPGTCWPDCWRFGRPCSSVSR